MPGLFSIKLESVYATQNFAADMAGKIEYPSVIAMTGNLGSGKTTFTQGFAKGMGIDEQVGSPTFKIVSEYQGKQGQLYHVDCYRLENETDFFNIGGEKYLDPVNAVTIIEWSEKIENAIPGNAIRMKFSRIDEKPESRSISITGWVP